WTDKPLSLYYSQPKTKQEKIYLAVYGFVLKKVDKIIFSTQWQNEIYDKYFHTGHKSEVIANAFPQVKAELKNKKISNRDILFAGRLIRLKNISRVIEAIRESCDVKLLLVGVGPEKEKLEKEIKDFSLESRVIIKDGVSSEKLDQYIADSFLVIVPSISEVSPNIALECIRLGKPILLTKESGFFDKYNNDLIFIDPFSISDIREKICGLLDETEYSKYLERIARIDISRSWQDLAKEHIELFKKL
ncbi:glycosyltransferase, partial [Candidatus Parcubacteria bacterium]